MQFYAIRHGKTKMNQLGIINGIIDEPLIEEGVTQASAAAMHIPDTVTIIIASPLRRAQHTAEIIAKYNNLPIITDERLREVSLGSLAGKRWDEMPDGENVKIKHRDMRYNYAPFGGDTTLSVTKRIKNFVKHLQTTYSDNQVLVVTHGGIIRTFMLLEHGKTDSSTLPNAALITFHSDIILSKPI